jgi:Xaa-Pro aminopeptidase
MCEDGRVLRRDRALAIAGGRTLVTADLATVSWLTGLVPEIEWGPSPFSAPPIAILDPDGRVLAIVSEDEAHELADDVEALTFTGFAVEDADRRAESLKLALAALAGAGPFAVELASLPGTLVHALATKRLDDVTGELQQARAVKDGDELEAIRAAIRVADAGQAAARAAFRPGSSELEVWTETRAAMEAAAGSRIPVLADLVTGARTADAGGPPGERRIEEPDLLLVDLVPRVGAYWGDSCATIALGEPSEVVRHAYTAALEALEVAKASIRPGVRAGDVDRVARSVVERAGGSYPHHSGHGLGLTVHEEPRIVPGSERMLETGMVLALEPGVYGDGWGLRVEQIVIVTDKGYELLSGHDLSL